MSTQGFDKLNNIKSMPFEKYFGEMVLSKEQKLKRIALAEKLDSAMQSIFILASIYSGVGVDGIEDLKQSLVDQFTVAISEFMTIDLLAQIYIDKLCADAINTTINHIDDEYYTSDDRARYFAENEANTFMNLAEFHQAVANGMTKKTWVTMNDIHVRQSHFIAEGQTIPIDDYFIVGTSFLLYPKDMSRNPDPAEVINCRCSIKYSK